MPSVTVELIVEVTQGRDAAAASAGGADALLLSRREHGGPLRPDPASVSQVVRESSAPVWVFLAEQAAGEEIVRDAARFAELGAGGVVFGALDRDLLVDVDRCADLGRRVAMPWLFAGIDRSLEPDRAWRAVTQLPGLAGVLAAGSTRGLEFGADELMGRAHADARIAELLIARGGLNPEQVPWLVRAGVRRFGVGQSVRDGASWHRGSVDAERVRAWRMLLDDARERANRQQR